MIMDRIALILAVIGGLNWGSVGLFRFDLVAYLFGGQTATVSRVVYTLVGDPANPVVLVLGNIIVMGIEGLMVCIQVLRLEFYEMFGRFYESGGRKFQPYMVDCTTKNDL